ncbi:MAG: TatD family hydrolase [Kiritimatiellae bacterium]|nr:TatD family hydrolase [Kiritimatiellia bacterium]
MTDAHFHRLGDTFAAVGGKEFRFLGIHPWSADNADAECEIDVLRGVLAANPSYGVGEIGLDRLKCRKVSERQREVFAAHLELASEMGRPVVLHGAKCWGEVVKMIRPYARKIPAFLFHGFSRSDGLLPDIVEMNGFVGVGKAVLNDHAVNYRELVKKLPADRLVVETDYEGDSIEEQKALLDSIFGKVETLTSLDKASIAANVVSFLKPLSDETVGVV